MRKKISIFLITILSILTVYLPKDSTVNAATNKSKINNYKLDIKKDREINNMITKNKSILRSLKSNSSLIHRYDFKNDVGSRVVDIGTEKVDGQIKGTQLINQNGSTFRRFDGIDDCIEFNSPIIPLGKKIIKFKMRVPQAPQSDNYCILSNRSSGERNQSGIAAFLYAKENAKRLYFQIWKDNNIQTTINCDFPYNSNFHEVMFVLDTDSRSNNVKLYIDDMVNPKSVTTCIGAESSNLFNFSIGKDAYRKGDYNFFKGDLEYLEVYNSLYTNSDEVNLRISFTNSLTKEYIVTSEEAEKFIKWYEDRSNGIGSMVYPLNKKISNNEFVKEYINFTSILNFEIR